MSEAELSAFKSRHHVAFELLWIDRKELSHILVIVRDSDKVK